MAYIYGWNKGGPDPVPLYVYDTGSTWGVTEDPGKAKVFPTIEACQEHYLSKHSFPEKYRENLHNGYVIYYNPDPVQVVIG